MSDGENTPFDRLERRVERLTSVVIIQCVLLAAVVLMDVLQLAPYAALFLLVALPIMVFYRRELPAAGRWVGRLLKKLRGTTGPVPNQTEEQAT